MEDYYFIIFFAMTCGLGLIYMGLISIECAIIDKKSCDELKQHMNRISEIIIEFEATEGNIYDTNKVAETIGKISAHVKRDCNGER